MNEQTPNQQGKPQQPGNNTDLNKHLHPKVWAGVLIAVLIIAGYGAYAYVSEIWPFGAAPSQDQESGSMNQGEETEDTANWQTYRNEEYGIELKYPEPEYSSDEPFAAQVKEGVVIQEQDEYVSIIPATISGGNPGRLNIFPVNYTRPDYTEFIERGDYTVAEIEVGGKRALVYEKINQNLLGKHKTIRLIDTPNSWDNTNEIVYELYDNTNKKSIELFDQILSTFRFIEPELDTSNWQTYRNEEYGFELKYPEDWLMDDNCTFPDSGLIAFGMNEQMVLCETDSGIGGPVSISIISISTAVSEIDSFQLIESLEESLLEAEREQVSVGSEPATRISGFTRASEFGLGPQGGLERIFVVFNNNEFLYNVSYLWDEEGTYREEFNQILSTFRFID